MQVIPLPEGKFTIDRSKVFVPFDIQKDDLQNRTTGSLLVEVQPFAVVTSNDILLFDTGLGFSTNGDMQIHSNLKRNNIQPEQITKVLLSHLHKDHAGGVSKPDILGNFELAFPKAHYYVQQKELEYALDKGFPSYMTEEIGALQNNPQVVLLNGNGLIDDYIEYQMTGAHSPFHQVFWLKKDKEIIFFGGDDAPQLQQMKHKYVAKYDFDGKKSMQLRQQWWKEGQEKKWKFLFYHDVRSPVVVS